MRESTDALIQQLLQIGNRLKNEFGIFGYKIESFEVKWSGRRFNGVCLFVTVH